MAIIFFSMLIFSIILYFILMRLNRLCNKDFSDKSTDNANYFKCRNCCSECKIGEWSYKLDKKSEACPYIICRKDGLCPFFEPLDSN